MYFLPFCICQALKKTAEEIRRDEAKERRAKEVEAEKNRAVAKRKEEKAAEARKKKENLLARANAAAQQEKVLRLAAALAEAQAQANPGSSGLKSSAGARNLVSKKLHCFDRYFFEFCRKSHSIFK